MAPKTVTVDDKEYLLEDLDDNTKKVVQECVTISNVITSKRLEMEIASIAQAKKLDELRELLVNFKSIEGWLSLRKLKSARLELLSRNFLLCYLWSSINWKGLSIVSPTFSIPGIWMSSNGIIKNRVTMTRKNLSSTFWLIFSFMGFRNWIYIIMFLVSLLGD